MKYWYNFLILFLFCSALNGQEQSGLAFSNYSPSINVLNNPTNVVNSKVLLDIHLIGYDVFLHNNYAFLKAKDFNYLNFIKNGSLPSTSYDNSREKYFLYSSIDIQLLSATYQYKEHGFGITSRIRTFVDLRKLPEVFTGAIEIEQISGERPEPNLLNLNRTLSADKMSITTLAYDDIGLTYANAIKHFDHDLIIVGGSVKYLLGVLGGGLEVDKLNFSIDTNDVFTYSDLEVSAAGANGDLGGKVSEWFAGKGFAFDLGITYKKMLDNVTYYNPFSPEGKCKQYDYKWKVSASIIDFGYIKFKKNSSFTSVNAGSGVVEDFSTLSPAGNPETFISNDLGTNVNVSKESAFSMWVPSALVLQGDYNFQNHFYFSGQYTIGFRRDGWLSVQRPDVLTLMPRYERRWFEISFPFALYNYQEVRSGVMVRIGGISFGTDKLGTYLSITNATGFDFYFHYAVKFYKKKGCRNKRDNRDYDVNKCRKY